MYSAPRLKQMQPYSASPPSSPRETCFKHPVPQCPSHTAFHTARSFPPSCPIQDGSPTPTPDPRPPTSTLRPEPRLPQPGTSFLDCSLQSQRFFQTLVWPSSWETSLVPWGILSPLDTKLLKWVSGALGARDGSHRCCLFMAWRMRGRGG